MFIFLRRAIRLFSLFIFVFSLWEFGVHLYGWTLYQPTAAQRLLTAQVRGPVLAEASGTYALLAKQEAERTTKVLDEMKKTGQPEPDSSVFKSMKYDLTSLNNRVDNIDYQFGLIDYSVTSIRETIELFLSLVALVVSSILVLVAWKPEPTYVTKTEG